MKHTTAVFSAALASVIAGASWAQQSQTMIIATGGVTGVYFPAGGAICLSVNARRVKHRVRCALTSTAGSVANLRALADRDVDFAVVQADWQGHAFDGTSAFQDDGPMTDLRSVFSIHPEFYTVVVRAGSEIASFDDLRGKRVNAGAPGSGQRATTRLLLDQMGWTEEDFAALTDIPAADSAAALCADEIDAMIYMVGHPSGAILEATSDCDSTIIPVAGDGRDALAKENPLYSVGVVPGSLYRGTDTDVETFSIDATLVTTADASDDMVYAVVSSVFDDLAQFRELHAAFENLDPERMVADSLTAPLHPDARRYYIEAGLLEDQAAKARP
ncbi:NMT1/THI5 like protein [Rhodobacteraceae bacterium THAF1]|uniref:TAXI family TRAP transporter solute-binding subunit n=1 Tax=Palleronia sp. THAF1 TaxID=2587842 RepID=UPI000F3C7519|nr:TAXI family TRAP transporter solute-binding subunit [Palleronia sp. THAF1]QFU09320.1 NMT1/THI5 like protein [Palleronia sp. THAF1]VDC26745.1 NMT1/THI5 like protein [Rhodobacteraceae bacterium THAF1]